MDWDDVSNDELEQLITDESLDKRGKALETLGMRYAFKTNFTVARAYLEQAVEVNDQVGDVEWASTSRQLLGQVLFRMGEFHESIHWLSEAALGFDSILWHRVLAETLHERGKSHRGLGNTADALRDFTDAADRLIALDKPVLAAQVLGDKADYEVFLGWFVFASDTLTRAREVLRTEPAFDDRLGLTTKILHMATALGRDASRDIDEGRTLLALTKNDELTIEFHAWTARYLISIGSVDEARQVIATLVESCGDSPARKQRLAVLEALITQASSEPLEGVAQLEAAHVIATSFKDHLWLPITTRLLADYLVTDGNSKEALRLLAVTLDDIRGFASRTDVVDLEILRAEIQADLGKWDALEDFHHCAELPFDDGFVSHFSRLLILAIRHAVANNAPMGEIIQRVKAATAMQWLMPDEYRPGGMVGCIPEDSHLLIEVPDYVRQFGFDQAVDLAPFNDSKVLETLGEAPLGSPVFRLDLSFLEPAKGAQS